MIAGYKWDLLYLNIFILFWNKKKKIKFILGKEFPINVCFWRKYMFYFYLLATCPEDLVDLTLSESENLMKPF